MMPDPTDHVRLTVHQIKTCVNQLCQVNSATDGQIKFPFNFTLPTNSFYLAQNTKFTDEDLVNIVEILKTEEFVDAEVQLISWPGGLAQIMPPVLSVNVTAYDQKRDGETFRMC
jgi:hypothetical protein